MASSAPKTHSTTNLCCLKLRLEKLLKECGEFGVGCNVTKCFDDEQLYENRPFVNINFVKSDKVERVKFDGPDGKKLGAEPLRGYEVETLVNFEIFVQACKKGDQTFCLASGISDYIDSLVGLPSALCVKNSEWNSEAHRTMDMSKGVVTVFSSSYLFTYYKVTSEPSVQSASLKRIDS